MKTSAWPAWVGLLVFALLSGLEGGCGEAREDDGEARGAMGRQGMEWSLGEPALLTLPACCLVYLQILTSLLTTPYTPVCLPTYLPTCLFDLFYLFT